MSTRRTPAWAPTLAWRTFCPLTLVALGWAGWGLFGDTPYRIDIDVYRMGGRAWLDGSPLYADGAMFATQGGLDLPFTYPPLAAIVFSPFAVMSLPAASAVITAVTLLLLIVAVVIVLSRLDVWTAGRRIWLAAAIVAVTVVHFEPIEANFDFGQINVVLMTLVIADCVPRRTPWPRGVLLGVAIALKLTPAVFLLYFLLRRDTRALLVSAASVVALTLLGFALAWRDSWEYWTETVRNTDRIGAATLNTNQNIAGTLGALRRRRRPPVHRVGAGVLRRTGIDGLGGAPRPARRRTGAGPDLRGDVRAGGLTGVVVAPLGVGAADGAGDSRGRPSHAARGAGRGRGARVRTDGLVADQPAARTPGDLGAAVASAGRRVVRVVGAVRHRGGRHAVRAVEAPHRTRRGDSARGGLGQSRGRLSDRGALLDIGGVQVDVLLTGEPHQFVHHLVDDRPLDEAVAREPLEPGEVHRLAEFDLDLAELPHLAARRVHDIGADHRDRDHRHAGLQREPGQSGLALVEPSVG